MITQLGIRRYASVLALILMATTVLVACSSLAESDPTPTPESGASGETTGLMLADAGTAPDFELVDDEGNTFRLSDQQGKAVGIFFGYTHCPDICPLTLSHMDTALNQLGEQADDVVFLFISVDPERDTPEQLNKYVNRANEDIVGLTGDLEDLEQVWEDYDITVQKEPQENGEYLVGHSAPVYLVNPDGELQLVLSPSADGEDLANDVQWVLEQSG